MSKCQNGSKPRQPKLRASCDGCFLAKVKCSKDRPICSRCLTTGAECGYSPSCRTGKSKAASASSPADQNQNHMVVRPDTSPNGGFSEMYEEPAITYTALNGEIAYSSDSPPYGIHPSWVTMQNGAVDSRLHRRSVSIGSISGLREDGIPESVSVSGGSDVYETTPFQWANNSNPMTRAGSINGFQQVPPPPRSKSMADVPAFPSSLEPWFDGQNDMFTFSPSPSNSNSIGGLFQKNMYSPSGGGADMMGNGNNPTCNCFNTSLQALQVLHNHTTSNTPLPSFDVVLTVNRRAVDGCAMMLNCSKCIGGTNANTTMMLLATIIGKVMSFYRAASQHYFGFTAHQSSYQPQPLPLTFGTYKIAEEDGRWLEMEILLRELRKLEEVLCKFQDVVEGREERWVGGGGSSGGGGGGGGVDGDGGVQSAVLSYLRQGLNITFEVLNMRRGMQHSQLQQGGGGGTRG